MIVESKPRGRQVIREVWRPLAALFVWDCAVTAFYYWTPFHAPSLPLTLFGTVVALFLAARGTSAYQRWWEARTLWGAMINASRSLSRMARNYLPAPEMRDLRRSVVLRHIAYVNALRCQLRRTPVDAEVLRLLSKGEAEPALARTNVANGLLDGTGRRVADAQARGWIDTIQQSAIEGVLVDIANAQGGMERIKNTPLPTHYRFFPEIFTKLLCVLLPVGLVDTLEFATPVGSTVAGLMFLAALAVGDDLTDPFAASVHDVPLSAMCRTIEIDLLQSIGDEAPAPLAPVEGVLW